MTAGSLGPTGNQVTYREVTLVMPALRSSRVHVPRTVVTSTQPLVHSLPDVFRRCRANSASLRFPWR